MKLEDLEKHCIDSLGDVGSYFDCGDELKNRHFITSVLRMIEIVRATKELRSIQRGEGKPWNSGAAMGNLLDAAIQRLENEYRRT